MVNASGRECNSAVANKMPTETLTILSTIFESKDKEKLAATRTLAVPASAVTNNMLCSTDMKFMQPHFV
jgi:hypothetical protein